MNKTVAKEVIGDVLCMPTGFQLVPINKGVRFVNDERFYKQGAEKSILHHPLLANILNEYPPTLLEREGEQALFLAYNFLRFQLNILGRSLQNDGNLSTTFSAIKATRTRALTLRNAIIVRNMGLPFEIARQHPTLEPEDPLSDSICPLMRAVDAFDVSKQRRFSTYAFPAIINHWISLQVIRAQKEKREFTKACNAPQVDQITPLEIACTNDATECFGRIQDMAALVLSKQERTVLEGLYCLNQSRRLAIKEMAKKIHCSPRSIQQIRDRAVSKLRCAAKHLGMTFDSF